MPRSIPLFGFAFTALFLAGWLLHVQRKPEPYQCEKQAAVQYASSLYAFLGEEVPFYGVATASTVTPDGFAYALCVVELFDAEGVSLAVFVMGMSSRELIYVHCRRFRPTAHLITKTQAYWIARDYVHNLGMMTYECPWRLAKTETDRRTPHIMRFRWTAGESLLQVAVDRSNSRLLYAKAHKITKKGYMPG